MPAKVVIPLACLVAILCYQISILIAHIIILVILVVIYLKYISRAPRNGQKSK